MTDFNEAVELKLSLDDVLVLTHLLQRWEEESDKSFPDKYRFHETITLGRAETLALLRLQGALLSTIVEIHDPEYASLVQEARKRLDAEAGFDE